MNNINYSYFAQRANLIFPNIVSNVIPYENLLDTIIQDFFENRISAKQLFLSVVGTYPTNIEMQQLNYLNEGERKLSSITSYFDDRIKESLNRKNTIKIEKVSKKIILDVTQSVGLDFTTGIQRVIREVFRNNRDLMGLGVWSECGTFFNLLSKQQEEFYLKCIPIQHSQIENISKNILLFGSEIFIFENLNWNRKILERYSSLQHETIISTLIYDTIPLETPHFTDPTTRNGFPIFLKSVLNFSRKIYGISQTQISSIKKWSNFFDVSSPTEYVLLPLGVDCFCRFDVEPKPVVNNSRRVLIVGTFDLRKNLLWIFSMLGNLPRNFCLEIAFVGPGGSMEIELREIIEIWKKLYSCNFSFDIFRNISDRELHDQYLLADFTIFLSFAEGFGLPVLESLAHRTPVLISDEPSILESAAHLGAVVLSLTEREMSEAKFLRMCLNDDYLRGVISDSELYKNDIPLWARMKESYTIDGKLASDQ